MSIQNNSYDSFHRLSTLSIVNILLKSTTFRNCFAVYHMYEVVHHCLTKLKNNQVTVIDTFIAKLLSEHLILLLLLILHLSNTKTNLDQISFSDV